MTRASSRAVVVLIVSLLAAWPGPAAADWVHGPISVMRPDGSIVRIDPRLVSSWWEDFRRARCLSCRGPQKAAQLLETVETAIGSRLRAGPRYLLLPEFLELSWPHAWVFYPSTSSTRAYVVQRGGVGAGVAPMRWDVWYRATPRMERIVREAAAPRSNPPEGAGTTSAGAVPLGVLAVVGGALAISAPRAP